MTFGGSRWRVPLVLFFAVAALFVSTANRSSVSVDAWAASVEAWHIAADGSPWLDDVSASSIARQSFIAEAPNGHVVAHRMAGPILVGVPFYAVSGPSPVAAEFSLVPAAVGAAFVTALAVLLMFLALRRHAPQSLATVAALAFAVTTPTWSVSADALWTHSVTQLGISGAAWTLATRRYWLSGVFMGLAMFGRPHVALLAAVIGIGLAVSKNDWRLLLKVGIPTTSSLCLLALWNRWIFGDWSIGGAYTGSMDAAVRTSQSQIVNYAGFLFAPDRGFLVWSPVVALALPGLVKHWRRAPAWSLLLAVGGLIYTFAQMRLNYFAGGAAFYGYRHGLELLTCLTPLLTFALQGMGKPWRWLFVALLGIQFAAISLGAVTEGFLLPLEVVWTDNSYWFALRHQPIAVTGWTLACVAATTIAYAAFRRYQVRVASSVESRVEQAAVRGF